MIFCQLPYLAYYDGTEAPELPAGMNFLPITVEGTELLFGAVPGKQRLNLAALCPDSTRDASQNGAFVSGETVVFCAKADNGALVTVGWYRNANVTALPEILPCENEDGTACDHPFFFCAHAEDAVLLPEDVRFSPCWAIPRGKSGARGKFGMTSDPVWFANEPAAQPWKTRFLAQLTAYAGDNWLSPDPSDPAEESGADCIN